MEESNKEIGYLGEQEFIKRLNNLGIPYTYIDGAYDIEIYNTPVEIKTTRLSHKFTDKRKTKQQYKIGRFDFTEYQRENELWTALFVRHNREFLFIGMIKTKKESPRYISIHKTRNMKLYTIEEFIKKVKL